MGIKRVLPVNGSPWFICYSNEQPSPWLGAVALLIIVFSRGIDTDDRHDNTDNGDCNTYKLHDNGNPHYVLKAPFLRFLIKSPPER